MLCEAARVFLNEILYYTHANFAPISRLHVDGRQLNTYQLINVHIMRL